MRGHVKKYIMFPTTSLIKNFPYNFNIIMQEFSGLKKQERLNQKCWIMQYIPT